MKSENNLQPGREGKRGLLRGFGIAVLTAGLILAITGLLSFFNSFGRGDAMPGHFGCFFVGLPLVWVGLVLCSAGFTGEPARHVARETVPNNRFTVALPVNKPLPVICNHCGQFNDMDSRFCKGCGAALPAIRVCVSCHTTNDPDAKFCDQCGRALV